MKTTAYKILEWIYPSRCPLCNEILNNGAPYFICPSCEDKLQVIEGAACHQCGAPLKYNSRCENCVGSFSFERNISAFVYNNSMRKIIHDMKYRKRPYKTASMAYLMIDKLSESLAFYKDFDLIIPVPLHKRRLRQRGYNQSLILAKAIETAIGVEVSEEICQRDVDSEKQSLLAPKERFDNVAGIFSLKNKASVLNKKIIIADDILTTGSTMNSLASMLMDRGANRIVGITLCVASVDKHID